jgi:hypothetical protein
MCRALRIKRSLTISGFDRRLQTVRFLTLSAACFTIDA